MFRQGDILILPTERTVTGAPAQPEAGRLVLARGEATGHHHSIAIGPQVAMFRPDDMPAGGFVLSVSAGAVALLEHQEHSTIPIPAGTYEVRRQREYSPEAIRTVAD